MLLYIRIIENKMTGSIFSQLPNNLIMNIIKMAEDERKNDEAIQNTKNNFQNVVKQIKEIDRDIKTFFMICIVKPTSNHYITIIDNECRSMSIREKFEKLNIIHEDESREGEIYDCNYYEYIFLCNVFNYIEDSNEEYYYNEEDPYEEDPETYRERSAEWDYNNPDEDAYDWGDEPSWA